MPHGRLELNDPNPNPTPNHPHHQHASPPSTPPPPSPPAATSYLARACANLWRAFSAPREPVSPPPPPTPYGSPPNEAYHTPPSGSPPPPPQPQPLPPRTRVRHGPPYPRRLPFTLTASSAPTRQVRVQLALPSERADDNGEVENEETTTTTHLAHEDEHHTEADAEVPPDETTLSDEEGALRARVRRICERERQLAALAAELDGRVRAVAQREAQLEQRAAAQRQQLTAERAHFWALQRALSQVVAAELDAIAVEQTALRDDFQQRAAAARTALDDMTRTARTTHRALADAGIPVPLRAPPPPPPPNGRQHTPPDDIASNGVVVPTATTLLADERRHAANGTHGNKPLVDVPVEQRKTTN